MDAQREAEGVDNESPPTDGKIEFKRTSKLSRKLKSLKQQEVDDVELDKPQLRGSKLVMPEYVIGQKPHKPKKCKTKSDQSRSASAAINHLCLPPSEREDQRAGQRKRKWQAETPTDATWPLLSILTAAPVAYATKHRYIALQWINADSSLINLLLKLSYKHLAKIL